MTMPFKLPHRATVEPEHYWVCSRVIFARDQDIVKLLHTQRNFSGRLFGSQLAAFIKHPFPTAGYPTGQAKTLLRPDKVCKPFLSREH